MRNVRSWVRCVLGLGVLGLALVSPARAGMLYGQGFLPTGDPFGSQNDPVNGNFGTQYDNFRLNADATIEAVTWVGGYYVGTPQMGAPTAFQIRFYADNAGAPGSLISSSTIQGTANQTYFAEHLIEKYPLFSYSAAVTFRASADTTYWMAIVADLAYPPQIWGWSVGTGGDQVAYQDWYGTWYRDPHDMTFELYGVSAVPEPSGLALAVAAIGCGGPLVAWRRRRAA